MDSETDFLSKEIWESIWLIYGERDLQTGFKSLLEFGPSEKDLIKALRNTFLRVFLNLYSSENLNSLFLGLDRNFSFKQITDKYPPPFLVFHRIRSITS